MDDAEKAFAQSRLALSVYLQAVFNDAKVLDARDWNIRAGISRYFSTPQVPYGITDVERATRLGIRTRYATVLQEALAATGDDRGEVGALRFPRTLEEANSGTVRVVPSYLFQRRADLVWDDENEFATCDFPYPGVARLSPSIRVKVYGQRLFDVKPPADPGAYVGVFDNGSQFYASAATQGTYDTAAADQPYYPKWRADKPGAAQDRVFGFDKLSDDYLRLNYTAYDLQKGAVHLYLSLGRMSMIAKLTLDPQGRLAYDAIYGQGLPPYGNYFRIIADHLAALKEGKRPVKGEAWFVHALEGSDGTPAFVKKTVPVAANLSLNFLEEVVDPKLVVMAAGGLSPEALDPVQKAWGHRSWLKEMVRLRFSDPWVWFWKNADIQMFYTIDREALFLKDLRDAERTSVGPLKDTLRRFIRQADADPDMCMLRRGSKHGADQRVIGSDDAWVYFYNNKQRLVTRLPMFVFWRDVNVAQISKVVYANTAGMIPFSKAVVWGGTLVIGWAVIGTQTLVMGARQYLRKKIASIAFDKLLESTFKAFKYRLLAQVVLPVLEVLGVGTAVGRLGGEKVYAFLKGLVEGITEHALSAMLDRWISFLNLEPASVRAIKLMIKIEAVLRWVDERMSALKTFASEKVSAALANRFVSVAVDAGQGFICIVNNLYFLDHAQVKDLLDLYAAAAGEKPPTRAEWDRIRHKQMLATIREWNTAIREEARDLADIYDDVQTAVRVGRYVVKGAIAAVIIDVVSAGGLVPLVIMAFRNVARGVVSLARSKAGKAAGGGFVAAVILSDDFRKEVLEFLGDFGDAAKTLSAPAQFAWGTPKRMQRFGQLLGLIIASLIVSRAVTKETKYRERWAASGKSYPKFVGRHFLMNQFNINPLLPALKMAAYHYVQLVEEVITESKQSFFDLETRIEEIWLGDPAYRDIIEVDEGLTLPKLLKIVKATEEMVNEWLRKLSKVPGLGGSIAAIGAKLQKLGPDKMPTFDDIRTGKLSEADWAREAFMFIALSHLHGGLNWLSAALEAMSVPVNPGDPAPVSVATLLQTLGFNLTDAEAEDLLDRNFDQVFEEAKP